jgi:hypothetical protein
MFSVVKRHITIISKEAFLRHGIVHPIPAVSVMSCSAKFSSSKDPDDQFKNVLIQTGALLHGYGDYLNHRTDKMQVNIDAMRENLEKQLEGSTETAVTAAVKNLEEKINQKEEANKEERRKKIDEAERKKSVERERNNKDKYEEMENKYANIQDNCKKAINKLLFKVFVVLVPALIGGYIFLEHFENNKRNKSATIE